MAVDNDPRPVLRQELARVFKNQRVIRAFEKIFDFIPTDINNQQEQIDAIISELTQLPSVGALIDQVAELQKQLQAFQLDAVPTTLGEVQKQVQDLQVVTPPTELGELQKQLRDLQQGPVI